MQTRARLGTLPRVAIILVTLGLLVALMTTLVIGAGSSPAPLELPPPHGLAGNGLIAHDGGADIWVMNPDGSNPRQLTSRPTMDFEPVWSPDGQLLAYWEVDIPGGGSNSSADPSSGSPSLVIVDAAGHERGRLAIPGRLSYEYVTPPSWAPDSRRLAIAYTSNRASRPIVHRDVVLGRRLLR